MNNDITHCTGTGCPLKELCRRFTTHVIDEMTWQMNPQYDVIDGDCPEFLNEKN